jgi:hypothetical protein
MHQRLRPSLGPAHRHRPHRRQHSPKHRHRPSRCQSCRIHTHTGQALAAVGRAGVTGIADPISVAIGLIVRRSGAVVEAVRKLVSIGVDEVGSAGALIDTVRGAVSVGIDVEDAASENSEPGLVGVDHTRAAPVANAVAVAVILERVPAVRTTVGAVVEAVAVGLETDRARNDTTSTSTPTASTGRKITSPSGSTSKTAPDRATSRRSPASPVRTSRRCPPRRSRTSGTSRSTGGLESLPRPRLEARSSASTRWTLRKTARRSAERPISCPEPASC